MVANINQATAAYGNAAKMKVDSPTQDAGAASGSGFGGALGNVMNDVSGSLKGAEAAGIQSMMGKSGISDVVGAISSAEMTLSTVVAIRDRVISAYQDILKMPI